MNYYTGDPYYWEGDDWSLNNATIAYTFETFVTLYIYILINT